jgi:hypothetical protein
VRQVRLTVELDDHMNEATTEATEEPTPALTVEDLNIEQLERRLELAATKAACACDKFL